VAPDEGDKSASVGRELGVGAVNDEAFDQEPGRSSPEKLGEEGDCEEETLAEGQISGTRSQAPHYSRKEDQVRSSF
jgi:hypothetical protein